jgi:hypothetical protein
MSLAAAVPAACRAATPMSSAGLTVQHDAAMSSADTTVIAGVSVTSRS